MAQTEAILPDQEAARNAAKAFYSAPWGFESLRFRLSLK
jgi:hypothetical protein